ncbi:MAG: thioredoxin [Candidatus Thermoplasmatota archaeon]|nr:thioredoxin [Candidatus Thermoplasmatota archaeon]
MRDDELEIQAIRQAKLARLQEAASQAGGPRDVDAADLAELLAQPGLVLVDFWAPWCGPCRAIAPVLEEIASEMAGSLTVAKLNVDDHPEVAQRYQVQGIPTMILVKDGQVVDRAVGALPKAQLVQRIEQAQQA